MPVNPYNELGVDREASPDEIKQAYRNKARQTHPDSGGNAEEFDRIQKSYMILKDPEARDHYDKTGRVNEKSQDMALDILADIFNNLLEQEAPLFVDYVEIMNGILDSTVNAIRKSLKDYEKRKVKLEKMQKKFKRKKKDKGFFEYAIAERIHEADDKIRRSKHALSNTQRAKLLLNEYEFEPDPKPSVEEMIRDANDRDMSSIIGAIFNQLGDRE